MWSSDDVTILPGPFCKETAPQWHSSITQASTAYRFVSSPLTQFLLIWRQITGEQEKHLVPLRVHFPEHSRKRVYLHIHNSDIMKPVKYLFFTAGSFWDNWANTSANTVSPPKHRGEAENRRSIHLSGQTIITLSRFYISVGGDVFHVLQVSW